MCGPSRGGSSCDPPCFLKLTHYRRPCAFAELSWTGATGLEPATSGVTDRRSTLRSRVAPASEHLFQAVLSGLERTNVRAIRSSDIRSTKPFSAQKPDAPDRN